MWISSCAQKNEKFSTVYPQNVENLRKLKTLWKVWKKIFEDLWKSRNLSGRIAGGRQKKRQKKKEIAGFYKELLDLKA